jgi:UDP-N-acetylmuramoylalanine--D-glutamate ligase
MSGSSRPDRPGGAAARMEGERIGVLGLARSGSAAAHLALALGAEVYASDMADTEAARDAAERIRSAGGEAEAGRHDVDRLAGCTRIVLSPGIPPDVAVLRDPRLASIPLIPEIDLAAMALSGRLIGVTGTNGKTTVVSLIEHVLRTAGRDAVAAGNIGTALSEIALRDPQPEIVVVEVSSFQLGISTGFAPEIGVLTNLAPDHLDRYATVEDYYADKARLFRNATDESRWVLNAEDDRAADLPGDAPGERFYFRVASEPAPNERGGYIDAAGNLMVRTAEVAEPVLSVSEMALLGPHNRANALAAVIAATLAGAEPAELAPGLRSFEAPPHRLEPVGEWDGVLWVNDSKATNLTSTLVALRSMDRPTVLLLGGRHKGEPYSQLVPEIHGRVRRVIAFGEAAPIIAADLAGEADVQTIDGGFDEAVTAARAAARPGDAILLSPACSSYDMFANYEERGRRFAELAARAAA